HPAGIADNLPLHCGEGTAKAIRPEPGNGFDVLLGVLTGDLDHGVKIGRGPAAENAGHASPPKVLRPRLAANALRFAVSSSLSQLGRISSNNCGRGTGLSTSANPRSHSVHC